MLTPTPPRRWYSSDIAILLYIALLKVALHIPFIEAYGYFRDELYYIACSNHLAWGYVDQPPLSIVLLKGMRVIFGDSLPSIRIVPVLAGAATVFLSGFMARQLGGGRSAQILAAVAALTAPVYIAVGTFFSMNAFDVLFLAMAASVVIQIVRNNAERLWLVFGLVAGLGVMNKYSMGFFLIGLGVGMILTPMRRHFLSRWFWMGAALGGFIVLPHFVWELRNGFPSLEFMHNATYLKNTPTSPLNLLLGEFIEVGPANAAVWIAGLLFAFVSVSGRPFRFFGYMFPAIFAIVAIGNGKAYYLSPVYTALFALGGCGLAVLSSKTGLRWVKAAVMILVLCLALPALPFVLPMLPVDTFIQYQTALGVPVPQDERGPAGILPQRYADMFGWTEMVDSVARVYHSLPESDRAKCLIYVRNYGEAGAIDFFGPAYGLPRATCTHNSYWYWKPDSWSGEVAIVFGSNNDTAACFADLRRFFDHVELASITTNRYAMPYENGRPIFVVRSSRITLDSLWVRDRHFI